MLNKRDSDTKGPTETVDKERKAVIQLTKMKASNESTISAFTDSSILSQNGHSNVKNTSAPAFSFNRDIIGKARMDTGDPIAGYIFMCNSKTKPDCFIYRVFGLPASRMAVVEKIMPNTKLFLFDFDVKLLYGRYVADSIGKLAIEPFAFEGRFPAQVKFSIARDCLPLPEVAFKEVIKENYSGRSKFNQVLSEEQVNKLVSLFRPITVPSLPRPSPVFQDAVDRGLSSQVTGFSSSHGQYSAGSDHTNMQLRPSSSHVQEVPFPPLHLAQNQLAVARTRTSASQPFHSESSFPHSDPSYVPETHHLDHPGLYQHDTHARYGTSVLEIISADSCCAPNLMPQSDIAPQQSQAMAASSSMTAAQWVAMASEAQTPGSHASSSTVSSSSELQLHYNDHYGQGPVPPLPQTSASGGVGVESINMYYGPTSSAALASEYQYQGYQTFCQMHSVATVQPASNIPTSVSEAYVPYMSTALPGYMRQERPISQQPVAGVSADPRAGYVPTYYSGPNPTF